MIIHHQVLSCVNSFVRSGARSSIFTSHPTACAVGYILVPLRGSMRPATSSSGSAGARCPETTRIQLPRKVTDKTASPIFRSLPESLPPAKILLRGPAHFRAPDGPARTHRDQTRRWRCIVAGLHSCPERLYRPPPAGGHSRVEPRSGFSDLWEPLCQRAAAQIRKTYPYPHQDASTKRLCRDQLCGSQ